MNLYEINSQIKRILDNGFNGSIDPETGEIIDEGEHDLETLEILRQDKLEGIALYIKNLNALADDIKAEEKSLAERRKAAEAKAERLSAYLADDLTSHGEKKLEIRGGHRRRIPPRHDMVQAHHHIQADAG